MSAWITDRVPTHKDGDTSGMVWTTEDGVVARSYTNSVTLGTPWQPITYPEPYVKPKTWLVTADGMNKHGRFYEWAALSPQARQAIEDALNKLEETP